MPRLKYILFLVFFSFVSTNIFSQKIFREGYIVKKTGGSFEGLVEYAPDKDIPSVCYFKRFDIAVEIPYHPGELIAFGYKNGKRFESLKIDNKESFYETMVKGELTLYRKGSKYYIQKTGSSVVEIKNGKVILKVEDSQREFNNPEELLKYLTEGSGINIKEKLNLKTDLVPIVVDFDRKSGTTYNVFKRGFSEKELTEQAWRSGVNRNKFGIEGGLNLYLLNITPKSSDYVPTPGSETGPLLGLSYERVISRKSDRFEVRAEIFYLKQTFYSYSEKTSGVTNPYQDDAFFNFNAVKVPLLFQYNINGKRIVPFINAGLSGTMFLSKSYYHIRETEVSNNDIYTSEDSNLIFKSHEITATAGAGVKIRLINNINLNLEGKFEYGPGFFSNYNYGEIAFKQKSIQTSFIIGITF